MAEGGSGKATRQKRGEGGRATAYTGTLTDAQCWRLLSAALADRLAPASALCCIPPVLPASYGRPSLDLLVLLRAAPRHHPLRLLTSSRRTQPSNPPGVHPNTRCESDGHTGPARRVSSALSTAHAMSSSSAYSAPWPMCPCDYRCSAPLLLQNKERCSAPAHTPAHTLLHTLARAGSTPSTATLVDLAVHQRSRSPHAPRPRIPRSGAFFSSVLLMCRLSPDSLRVPLLPRPPCPLCRPHAPPHPPCSAPIQPLVRPAPGHFPRAPHQLAGAQTPAPAFRAACVLRGSERRAEREASRLAQESEP
jgi:hypothetical protein